MPLVYDNYLTQFKRPMTLGILQSWSQGFIEIGVIKSGTLSKKKIAVILANQRSHYSDRGIDKTPNA